MTAKTVPAPDITKQVNDLLRDEPRLLAAAPLIDRVSVVLKLAPRKVKPPPPLAWLKVAKLSILSPAQRAEQARLGGEAEAQITVDEALWSRLDATGRRAALVLALRGLYEETVGDEDPQEVVRKAPAPYQTWADTAAEMSELVAAFREDAAAAALESDAAERLGVLPLYNLIRDLRIALAEADLEADRGDDANMEEALEHWPTIRPRLAARCRAALGENDPETVAGEDDGEANEVAS